MDHPSIIATYSWITKELQQNTHGSPKNYSKILRDQSGIVEIFPNSKILSKKYCKILKDHPRIIQHNTQGSPKNCRNIPKGHRRIEAKYSRIAQELQQNTLAMNALRSLNNLDLVIFPHKNIHESHQGFVKSKSTPNYLVPRTT